MYQREGAAAREDPGMTSSSAADVQAAFSTVVVDEWARAGVTEAVVAPGSRSTPLVLALDADPRIRVHLVLDERSAGFVAVGLGLATGRPAVVATTSGTASVELHPSIVEAFHAGVPLLAITTDRPPELHLVGAPQTIEQDGLFGPAVRWTVSPGVADQGGMNSWRSVASRCVAEAIGVGSGRPGPVHVNLAFREPLLGTATRVKTPPGRPGGAPWHDYRPVVAGRPPEPVVDLLRAHAGQRGLIVAGAGAGDPDLLLQLAARLGWPVLADPRSGCRVLSSPAIPVVGAADALLRIPLIAAWQPEIILRAGAPWASKVLNGWIGGLAASVTQVLLDPSGAWRDAERTASHVVPAGAGALLAAVFPGPSPGKGDSPGDWRTRWFKAQEAAEEALDARLRPGAAWALSEPAVARAVLAGLPDGARLLTSSSMPVRDVEWFGAGRGGSGPGGSGRGGSGRGGSGRSGARRSGARRSGARRSGVEVVANRGANGIDGVVSTATGLALADGRPTVALLGDLAFLYDASSLIWLSEREVVLTFIVVDNDGGGIFSFLPQAGALDAGRFERYWGTPHGLDIGEVAGAYGIEVHQLANRAALDALVADAAKPGVRVGLVRSDRVANVRIHEELNAAVAEAVSAALGFPGVGAG
jgi:2-succinyl-5-enolpyruvyl-6-hydroxy-3-cyclohexene-1-carboxylate synthase